MVTFAMEPPQEAATFEAAFPQLYYRVRSLKDRLTAYFLRGQTECLVSVFYRPTSTPRFAEVAFDEAEAERYERRMLKFFEKNGRTGSALPRPPFPVRLLVVFGDGSREWQEFPFGAYSEETVLAFCTCLEQRSEHLCRHRFQER